MCIIIDNIVYPTNGIVLLSVPFAGWSVLMGTCIECCGKCAWLISWSPPTPLPPPSPSAPPRELLSNSTMTASTVGSQSLTARRLALGQSYFDAAKTCVSTTTLLYIHVCMYMYIHVYRVAVVHLVYRMCTCIWILCTCTVYMYSLTLNSIYI